MTVGSRVGIVQPVSSSWFHSGFTHACDLLYLHALFSCTSLASAIIDSCWFADLLTGTDQFAVVRGAWRFPGRLGVLEERQQGGRLRGWAHFVGADLSACSERGWMGG